uniref:Uncharacterized protein TCIL3000_11_3730 n=1 Tax=Trypanosoma congolense (strain IL3000) TaxID=1068625 RepID=G0V004_TRYCI|nr:unnamed protein product [Trypanosoma congolense IL3000]
MHRCTICTGRCHSHRSIPFHALGYVSATFHTAAFQPHPSARWGCVIACTNFNVTRSSHTKAMRDEQTFPLAHTKSLQRMFFFFFEKRKGMTKLGVFAQNDVRITYRTAGEGMGNQSHERGGLVQFVRKSVCSLHPLTQSSVTIHNANPGNGLQTKQKERLQTIATVCVHVCVGKAPRVIKMQCTLMPEHILPEGKSIQISRQSFYRD